VTEKLFRFYGGKYWLIPEIIKSIAPIHYGIRTWVDVFGGSGTVLLNIPREYEGVRVWNDINSDLYHLMKAMQDEKSRNMLINQMQWYLYSREEFDRIKDKQMSGAQLEPHEMLFIIATSFHGSMDTFGYPIIEPRQEIHTVLRSLRDNWRYMQDWVLEHLDYKDLIKRYDRPSTFFYLDPPYITNSLRSGERYNGQNEVNFDEMCDILNNIQGKYLLNEIYEDEAVISSKLGPPKKVQEVRNHFGINLDEENYRPTRKECYWANFDIKGTGYPEGTTQLNISAKQEVISQ